MNRNPKFRTILTAFMVVVLLLGGTLSATGSSAMVDQAAPLPPGKQSVGSGALPGVPAAPPPVSTGQGLYIRLTGYTFDPLIEATPHALVFQAGTALRDGSLVTNGGRVLGVTGMGKDLRDAKDAAYAAAAKIRWEGCFYRKDIAWQALR